MNRCVFFIVAFSTAAAEINIANAIVIDGITQLSPQE